MDPLGIPLTTTIISGHCADDPLYVPEIRKVQACIQQHGVLYVGDCKMAALNARLEKAEKAIAGLNLRGRGRKNLTENEMRDKANALLQDRNVPGLLTLEILKETQTVGQRGALAETVTVNTSRDLMAYENVVRSLGWRVLACNDPELSLTEAVPAYREEYLIERGFRPFP